MGTIRRSITFAIITLLVGSGSLFFGSTPAAACPVDGGTVNGMDSGLEYGYPPGYYPGDDNPYDDQGTYSVDNDWHDSRLYEWCTANDQMREDWLRWSSSAIDALVAQQCCRTLGVETHVYPHTSYNCVCAQSSNLPYTFLFIANAFWEGQQGYAETSFIMDDPQFLVANTNYWAQLTWSQEPTAFSWMETIVQWMKNPEDFYESVAWDAVGNWSKQTQQ
jgi:hypothetical protein